MTPLLAYLNELREIRSSGAGTAETSFYPAIKALLDSVGNDLRPKVRCIMNLRDQGAGLPDGGLFTADQLGRGAPDAERVSRLLAGAAPARGAVEIKPPSWELLTLAGSSQVSRYGTRYRHVLLTNLREFCVVEHSPKAKPRVLEQFSLASSEQQLWKLAAHPRDVADGVELRLLSFIERAMRLPAPLEAPEDLAWFLAAYAREALYTIEHGNAGGLDDISDSLGRALGVGFQGAKGRHFFNSTLVQTLFYGVFSAWVLWARTGPAESEKFKWKDTSDLLHLTMLRVLFHEMTRPTTLFTNFLREGLDLAEATLNRVDRDVFFSRFKQHEAVQYFYEPFLEAFDPELRRELGVWYTPPEVVSYMVERTDRALREQLGVVNGLADPSVQVLDPCCGTGAYLIAVLERIAKTLRDQGEESTVAAQVAQAAMDRLFGFEILPAPYVISHLQVALYLQELGVQLGDDDRASIFLTNALTGWTPARGRQEKLLPELAAERDAADKVKRTAKILVVIGNPPYNAFAGVQPEEEQESVDVYKEGLVRRWRIRKFNLDDLFVRFFRLAERKIAEQSKRGIVCFISNAAYTADSSFVVFRERFLKQFRSITIDNLNGDSRETGKLTPEGQPDPSVFSTERNREGIRVGTAIGLFVLAGNSRGEASRPADVRWRDFWGVSKREELIKSLSASSKYQKVVPSEKTRWSYKPQRGSVAYHSWPTITELCQHEPVSGLAEKRKGGLFAHERSQLGRRMEAYFDKTQEWEDVQNQIGELAHNAADYKARQTREKLLRAGGQFRPEQIRRYALLPLDNRWCYWSSAIPLWNRARPVLAEQAWQGNSFLVLRPSARQPHEGRPTYITSALPDHHMLDPNVVAIPLRWKVATMGKEVVAANLNPRARAYLRDLGLTASDDSEEAATALWYHALAMTYSPAYLTENGSAVRAAYPRIPLPLQKKVLELSVALGRRIAELLDPDVAVAGVTSGVIRPELRVLGSLAREDGKQIDLSAGDLTVDARWGTLQRETVVMPGPGKTTEAFDPALKGHPLRQGALNVWLNSTVYWRNVPGEVWEFAIGGYQVIKKWLSYREKAVLGRGLSLEEAQHTTAMVRRLATILLMREELDSVYAACCAATYELPSADSVARSSSREKTAQR
jgi:hypothetical protein